MNAWKTCATCRFWTETKWPPLRCCKAEHITHGDLTFGKAEPPEIPKKGLHIIDGEVNIVDQYASGELPLERDTVFTGPDYGCVHWEVAAPTVVFDPDGSLTISNPFDGLDKIEATIAEHTFPENYGDDNGLKNADAILEDMGFERIGPWKDDHGTDLGTFSADVRRRTISRAGGPGFD